MHRLTDFPKALIFAALILIPSWFFPLAASAQTTSEIVAQQDWITRQQQNQITKNRLLRQQEAAKNAQKIQVARKDNLVSANVEKCVPIKTVHLSDAKALSKKEQEDLTKPFIGQCVNSEVLATIVSTIQNYYNDRGYVVAQALLPKQDFTTGDLEVKILEGKVNKIILGKNGTTDKMQTFTAFGNLEGDTLNMSDLNQGINQMNRLPANSASISKIDLDSDAGAADVYVANNKKRFPGHASIGYDSLGNKYTGINRANFAGELDNLLFLNDALNVSYTENIDSNRDRNNNKTFTTDFSIPFGYNTFTYDYSRSESTNKTDSANITGYSESNNFMLERLLFSKGNLTISGNTSLTVKSAASYLDHHKIDISERHLTLANLEFALSNTLENGVNIYIKPTYTKGLKILNAQKDNESPSNSLPKSQYQRIKLYATVSKEFKLPKLNTPFVLETDMDSQYSEDELYGSEQFAIGGYDSVRGFRDYFLTGNSGYYFRNSATFNVGSLILPLMDKSPAYLSNLSKFKLQPFYDYGFVLIKHSGNSGRLSGAGIKTIFESQYFTASLTYSAVTSRSQLISSKENKIIYFEISLSCC